MGTSCLISRFPTVFFPEESEAPGLMLVGSDRSVAAILPPGCMFLAKKFTTPTTSTPGVDLRQARDRFQKFSELLHPKVAVAKALWRVVKSPKNLFVYKFW